MTISQAKNGVITVKQTEYIKKIVTQAGVTKTSVSCNHPDLMKRKNSDTAVALGDPKRYLSLVMSAMFVAKRTRPEILPAVCILVSRVQNPDEQDMKCLLRVFEYLKGSTDLGLRYKPDEITLYYWIDASYYNLHHDSRGHTGIVATIGRKNAPIYVRSQKHKLHTRSSTESELATDEGVLHLLWMILVFDCVSRQSVYDASVSNWAVQVRAPETHGREI
jgi:hypothetical protein